MTPSDPSKGFAGMMANSDPENDTMMFGGFGFKVMMNIPLVTRKDGVCLILKRRGRYLLYPGEWLHDHAIFCKPGKTKL